MCYVKSTNPRPPRRTRRGIHREGASWDDCFTKSKTPRTGETSSRNFPKVSSQHEHQHSKIPNDGHNNSNRFGYGGCVIVRKQRTGNPFVDGLIGIEPNPGPRTHHNRGVLDPLVDGVATAAYDLSKGRIASAIEDVLSIPEKTVEEIDASTAQLIDKNNPFRPRYKEPYSDGLVGIEPNPGPGSKGFKKGKGNNQKKKKQKQKQKQTTKNFNKSVAAAKSATAVASSLSTVYRAKTYNDIKYASNGSVRVKGRQRLNTLIAPTGSNVQGKIIAAINIASGIFATTRLDQFFKQYERWRPNKISFSVTPHAASTTVGSYFLFAEPDPDDAIALSGNMDINALANQQSVAETPVWGIANHTIRLRDNRDPDLYTTAQTPAFTQLGTGASDPRLYSAGQLLVVVGDPIVAGTIIGALTIEYDITFSLAVEGSAIVPSLDACVVPTSASMPTKIATLVPSGSTNSTINLCSSTGSHPALLDSMGAYSSQNNVSACGVWMNMSMMSSATPLGAGFRLMLPTGEYLLDMALLLGTSGNGLTNLSSIYLSTLAGVGQYYQTVTKIIKDYTGSFVTGSGYSRFYDQIQNGATWPTTLYNTALNSSPVLHRFAPANVYFDSGYINKRLYRATEVLRVTPMNSTIAVTSGLTPIDFALTMSCSAAASADVDIVGVGLRIMRISSGVSEPLFLPSPDPVIALGSGKDEVKDDCESPVVIEENPMTRSIHIPRSAFSALVGFK